MINITKQRQFSFVAFIYLQIHVENHVTLSGNTLGEKKDEYQNPTIKKSNLICLEEINTYTVKGDMGQNRDV